MSCSRPFAASDCVTTTRRKGRSWTWLWAGCTRRDLSWIPCVRSLRSILSRNGVSGKAGRVHIDDMFNDLLNASPRQRH